MNYLLILKLIGSMLGIEAVFLLFPFTVSLIYNSSDKSAFLWSIIISAVIGLLLSLVKPKDNTFKSKDAFLAASLSWLLFSIFGALPFYLSGYFNSFIDCLFESVSGFTTTGSSILTDIESLPKGVLFWRSFSHWIGGMGVLVFMLAVVPGVNASSVNLMLAESTGPAPNKILPKIRETARVMYGIYLVMTLILIGILLFTKIPLFDALILGFSTAGTGGFAITNTSVAAYNNVPLEIILSIFMFLFGISFTLYYYAIKKNFKQVFIDEELRLYFTIVLVSILIITLNITGYYGSLWTALRHASFQVSTVISTTGFSSTDYNLWPELSRMILVILMLTGCCAGSTGGGIKLIRIHILFKALRMEVSKIIHPQSIKTFTLNGKKADPQLVTKIGLFCFVYFLFFLVSVSILAWEGRDLVTSTTAVVSALSNIGPGLDGVGPMENYQNFTWLSKIVLTFCMLAGRLEFFPILIMFNLRISNLFRKDV